MGLQLTLAKENNVQYADYADAYWKLTNIAYSTTAIAFSLECFPSRDASAKNLTNMPSPSLPIGGANATVYNTSLYRWDAMFAITDVFPSGIPLDENEQKTAIYTFIKAYTPSIHWVDVYEN